MVGFEIKQITELLQERKTVGRFWLKSVYGMGGTGEYRRDTYVEVPVFLTAVWEG